MNIKKNIPQTSVIGASGEYLVLSTLLKHNFIAGKAPDNTKDYDLVVINKDGTSTSPIQVKTVIQQNENDVSNGWMLQEKHEKPIKNLIYCLVRLNLNSNNSEIYVIDSTTVATAIKMSHQIWLKIPGLNGKKHKNTSMRRLMHDNTKISMLNKLKNKNEYLNKEEINFISSYSDGWLKKYKDAWHLIK